MSNCKFKSIQFLIPTMKKSLEGALELLRQMNINADAIIANQCDIEGFREIEFNSHHIVIISTKTRGVSMNRNILLKNLTADVGMFLDDDCYVLPGYEKKVIDVFNKYDLDAAIFNGYTSCNCSEKVRNISNKIVRRYSDISFAGGPGMCISREAINKFNLAFNEKVGAPNYLYAGEDSLFAHELLIKKLRVYRCGDPIYKILVDMTESSTYFTGYNEQFFATKGAIMKLTRPHSYWLAILYYDFRYLYTKNNIFKIHKMIKKGFKFVRKGTIVDG